jgi:hypothetical protein
MAGGIREQWEAGRATLTIIQPEFNARQWTRPNSQSVATQWPPRFFSDGKKIDTGTS